MLSRRLFQVGVSAAVSVLLAVTIFYAIDRQRPFYVAHRDELNGARIEKQASLEATYSGFFFMGPGLYASLPDQAELDVWLQYQDKIPLNSHSEFSLNFSSNLYHQFPPGTNTFTVSATKDIDIYSTRGAQFPDGGPYVVEYAVDSPSYYQSTSWSIVPNETGKKGFGSQIYILVQGFQVYLALKNVVDFQKGTSCMTKIVGLYMATLMLTYWCYGKMGFQRNGTVDSKYF